MALHAAAGSDLSDRFTALDQAANKNHAEVAKMLLQHSADVNAETQ
jgi:ankyrin repeat protein